MNLRRLLSLAALLGLISGCQPHKEARLGSTESLPALVEIAIRTAGAAEVFHVEVARSPEEQERGLMFRERLAADGGMIFPFDPPRRAAFWMKNTVIPLDLIFIRSNGTIARIAPQATPLSLAPIDSGESVAAVLEIAGGKAAEKGIRTGDHVDLGAVSAMHAD